MPSRSETEPALAQLTERVVLAFLQIFRSQMGVAPEQASARPAAPESREAPGTTIYEFQTRVGDKIHSRRMSIAPLTEGIHSKSRCFRVIYDNCLVVKIPPTPIADFNAYLNLIATEKQIARQLTPEIVCITPGLGVVMNKIPGIPVDSTLDLERRETLLTQRLQRNPDLQRFLKVGPNFALFSALADHHFLNEVIADIHDPLRELPCEIQDSLNTLWHHGDLDSLYSGATVAAIMDMDRLFRKFEPQLRHLARSLRLLRPLDTHWRRTAFISLLSGTDLPRQTSPNHPDLMEGVHRIWQPLAASASRELAQFKTCLEQRAEANKYHRCRTYMESLSHQVLCLLQQLQDKAVAIRDLKPDNIFTLKISSLPEGVYTTPAVDALGLIDLETAVSLKPEEDSQLRQPLLTGSPAYATPANLFENHVLKSLFPDIPWIFLLQDWYAVVGVIFKIITGQVLFQRTGGIFPQILQIRTQAGLAKGTAFQQTSTLFWRSVINEFQEQHGRFREPLALMRIETPAKIRDAMDRTLAKEAAFLAPAAQGPLRTGARRAAHYQRLKALLDKTHGEITGDLRLRTILATVYSGMYPSPWEGDSSPGIWRV